MFFFCCKVNSVTIQSNGAELGESTSLICESNTQIRTWYKSDFGQTYSTLVYNGTENRVYIFNENFSTRSTLTIDYVVASDFGTYTCIDAGLQSAFAYFSERI